MQVPTSDVKCAGALLLALLCAGCPQDPLLIDDVDPIGAVDGSFSCIIYSATEDRFDLGAAQLEGDLDSTDFIAGLRTQGCIARRITADRGDVVSVALLQQTRFDRAQILELDLPVSVLSERADSPLVVNDVVVFAGNGGFGSMYSLDPGEDPHLFARTAGGGVLLSQWGVDEDAVIAGTFTGLRMGAL